MTGPVRKPVRGQSERCVHAWSESLPKQRELFCRLVEADSVDNDVKVLAITLLERHEPLPFGQHLLAGLFEAFEIVVTSVFDLHV